MKTWTIPVATAQQFTANEYVSACTFTLKCDVPMNGFTQDAIELPKHYPVCNGKGGTAGYVQSTTYKQCQEPYHPDISTNGEFVPVTFTYGQKNGKLTNLDAPIDAYFWAMFCECDTHDEPHIVQGHATMSNVLNDANKS